MSANPSLPWHPSAHAHNHLPYPYNATDHNRSEVVVSTNYLSSKKAIQLVAKVHESTDLLETYLETSPNYEMHLQRSSIIYGLSKIAENAEVASHLTDKCQRHFRQIQRGMQRKEPWAMKGSHLNSSLSSFLNSVCR